MRLLAAGALLLALSAGVARAAGSEPQARLALSSPAFRNGQAIPQAYTCDGTQKIVPLRWSGVPRGTRSFALLVDDPDAPSGTFTHRVAWGIPGTARALPGRAPREGATSAGRAGWVGPCPPSGTHRYVFRLYALRSTPSLQAGADKPALLVALKGRVIASAVLVGRYGR